MGSETLTGQEAWDDCIAHNGHVGTFTHVDRSREIFRGSELNIFDRTGSHPSPVLDRVARTEKKRAPSFPATQFLAKMQVLTADRLNFLMEDAACFDRFIV